MAQLTHITSPETSEPLAVANDANNNNRERPVVSALVSWSLTATTMDNDGPDTATRMCLDRGISIHTGGADKDVAVTGPDNVIITVAAFTEPQQNIGGQPVRSTNTNKQKNKQKWKQATNWVIV